MIDWIRRLLFGRKKCKPEPMTPEEAERCVEAIKRYEHNRKIWDSRGYGCICLPNKLDNGYYEAGGLWVSSLCPLHGELVGRDENPSPGTAEYRGRVEYRRINGISS